MKVYYAHSLLSYGTEKEKEELAHIKSIFHDVICPNNDIGEATRGLTAYLAIIRWSDILIASEFQSHIGMGVYKEIEYALSLNKRCLCLRKVAGKFSLIPIHQVEMVNATDRKITYGRIVAHF
jgi:hypothetical protein